MKGGMIDSGEETIQSGFNFRGVGKFTFNGGTGHLGVVISWLVGERGREKVVCKRASAAVERTASAML